MKKCVFFCIFFLAAATALKAEPLTKTISIEGKEKKVMVMECIEEFNEAGMLIMEKDKNGVTTKYTYNNKNLLIHSEASDNVQKDYTYDKEGHLEKIVTSINGTTTVYSRKLLYNIGGYYQGYVDSDGTKLILSKGGQTLYEKNENPRKEKMFYYNKENRLIRIKFLSGGEILYEYDSHGNVTVEKHKDFIVTTKYLYDSKGNLISKISDNGVETSYEYDERNQLIYQKEPQSWYKEKWLEYEYFADGSTVRYIHTFCKL